MWDEYFEYKNGEWYCEGEKSNEPSYYPWKESRTILWLDSPVILDFEGTRLEIEYWTGSLVNVNINSIDTDLYGADVSKNFMRNIIGKKLIDIEILFVAGDTLLSKEYWSFGIGFYCQGNNDK